MMLLLLHGPAINNSRLRLTAVRQKFDANNVVVYEAGVDIQEITGTLLTMPLLTEQRLIILENPQEDFRLPTTNPSSLGTGYQLPTALVLWFDHEVGDKKPIMEWVKKNKGQVFYFPESKEISVFPFLDYLANKDKKAFLEMQKLKEAAVPAGRQGFDIHYQLTMVFYLLRSLVATPANAPDFVRKKLAKQRARFSLEDIESLYNATRYKTRNDVIASYYKDMLEIEFKLKSGLLEKSQAEFLLVNKFIENPVL